MDSVYTASEDETFQKGFLFAETVKPGDVVCFYGDLGVGKTVFIKGIAKKLGVSKRITSPTFIVLRHYASSVPLTSFYHIDLYRTNGVSDLVSVGIDELLRDRSAIVAIEWAEKLLSLLPKKRIDVFLSYAGDKRSIEVKRHG